MGEQTKIEWADHTFNPWWGCQKVSPGCTNCYAEGLSKRFGKNIWGPPHATDRRLFGDRHWAEPLKWNRQAEQAGVRARVFCASMADVFEDHPQVNPERGRLWDLIDDTPWLDWLLLTKRPESALWMVPWDVLSVPLNVWIGVSVEDQQRADERIPILREIPAAIRFLSVEPLLEHVNAFVLNCSRCKGSASVPVPGGGAACPDCFDDPAGQGLYTVSGLHWVIVGGESGPNARPMHPAWARSLRDQCVNSGVPFFFKQWGEFAPAQSSDRGAFAFHPRGMTALTDDNPFDPFAAGHPNWSRMARVGKRAAGRELDGRTWDGFPAAVVP